MACKGVFVTRTCFRDDVLKNLQYFFYVSCRFPDEKDTVLDMINNKLFDDIKMKEIALYVLKNCPECCLILLDGADELTGSPTSETGRRGDIAGLPGLAGVKGCVILITSRPLRFHTLSKKTQKIFKCLKINGIKDLADLTTRILHNWTINIQNYHLGGFYVRLERRICLN